MKLLKNLTLFALVLSIGALWSCNPDDGDDPQTPQELTLEALQGTWNLDASTSQLANTGIDGSGISVTITSTGFTLSGDLTSYLDKVSYSVNEDGELESPSVNITSSDIELDGDVSVSLNGAMDTLTVSFSTKLAEGRVDGLGDFKLVFVKAS